MSNDLLGSTFEYIGIKNSYSSQYFFSKDYQGVTYAYPSKLPTFKPVGLVFSYDNTATQKTIEPENIFSALAKIGGMLGLLRFFRSLACFMRWDLKINLTSSRCNSKRKRKKVVIK